MKSKEQAEVGFEGEPQPKAGSNWRRNATLVVVTSLLIGANVYVNRDWIFEDAYKKAGYASENQRETPSYATGVPSDAYPHLKKFKYTSRESLAKEEAYAKANSGLAENFQSEDYATKKTKDGFDYLELQAPFKVGKNDGLEYRGIKLLNGLQAIVISDPNAKQGLVGFNTEAGPAYDPSYLPGTSYHANEILRQVSQVGGEFHRNFRNTPGRAYYHFFHEKWAFKTYHFQPNDATQVLKSLSNVYKIDQVSQTDAANALTESKDAIYWFKRNHIFSREQVNRYLSNSSHWYSNNKLAPTRNRKEVLTDINRIRETIANFIKKHYTAQNTKLFVVSSDPTQRVIDTIVENYSSLEAGERPAEISSNLPFLESQKCIKIYMGAEKDIVVMQFLIPKELDLHQEKHFSFVTSLFKSKVVGSFFHNLKKLFVITDIWAEIKGHQGSFSFVRISVFTPGASEETRDWIAYSVLTYLKYMKSFGTYEVLFDSMKFQEVAKFQTGNVYPEYMEITLEKMFDPRPFQDILYNHVMGVNFNMSKIQKTFEYLTVDNLRLYYLSTDYDPSTSNDEDDFGTKITVQEIDPAFKQEINHLNHKYLNL